MEWLKLKSRYFVDMICTERDCQKAVCQKCHPTEDLAIQNQPNESIRPQSLQLHSVAELKSDTMAALNDIVTSYKALKTEWNKKPQRLDKCGEILEKLKVSLIEVTFLPTCNNVASQKELLVARDILEIGVQWAVAVKDSAAFERYMAQLKTYYYDYKNELPESPYTYQLLGLNLLFLLSLNRVAEFHTELELLPPESIQSDLYIRHPLALEQYLMEGSYNKIFLAKGNVPAESYNFFMDTLLDTVRDEIGACLEKAYNKMSINEAARRLNISSQNAITAYCAKKNWKLNPENFYQFASEKEEVKTPFPALELAEQTISYASELEMIV